MPDSAGRHYEGDLLKKYVDRFPQARILVIGDIIMDKYVWGGVSRISPEAPVPVVEVKRETKMLGGAANVIHNIASLGAAPILCGVIGQDHVGDEILQKINDMGLSTEGIIVENRRPTCIKTRVVAQNQQVVRFDRESLSNIMPETIQKLLDVIGDNLDELEVAVDPKTNNFEYYQCVDVITPNHYEAGAFCRFEIVDDKTLLQAGRLMLSRLNSRSVLITQGKDGMTLFENNGEITHIPTIAKNVFDVTGAGDTVIGTFSLGLAAGLAPKLAAILSNFAAGIVVGEVGTSTVSAEQLKKAIGE